MLLKVCTQCSREEERIKNGDLERKSRIYVFRMQY